MKKILSFLLVSILTISVNTTLKAQSSVSPKIKTITTADTVTFQAVPSKIKSFQYTYTETSGTTAGKIYLEGTDDLQGSWKIIDSVALADVTTKQGLISPVTATSYTHYRFRNTNTSSATGTIRALYMRRTDE